jgi:predicted RNA methylase
MPLDDTLRGNSGTELVPRATIEEIVAHRNKALELYAEAFEAIAAADATIKAARAEADKAHPGADGAGFYDNAQEVKAFFKAVRLPDRAQYLRVARRLLDIDVWRWVIRYTDLERLMDHEAKEKLRRQMQYVPERVDPNTRQLITGEEIEAGLPPVTVENIYATIQSFAADAETIFRRGIANVFSQLDRRFRSHDGFKIGSRVILTYAFSSYGGGLEYGKTRDLLLDIERTFAVIDNEGHPGAQYGQGVWALDQDRRGSYGPHQSVTETKYFRIRGYQNGNAHLWFTRDDLVEKVNKLLAEYYGEVIGDGNTAEPDIFSQDAAAARTPARRFGFFPTPDGAARAIMEKVSLHRRDGDAPLEILEPSAGTGNLARACALAASHGSWEWDSARRERVESPGAPHGHKVDCVEMQPELAAKLTDEGIYRRVVCADFLRLRPEPRYDRVVMNPPFDLQRDIDHVTHALKFLKPDGELVAIMSAGTEFRETAKAKAFRKLVIDQMRGRFTDLPAGSFAEVGTNVNTLILHVRKDGRPVRSW